MAQATRTSHLILRKLLQVDKPAPERTEAELNVEVERNYRWNFSVNLLDGTTFWFGLSFFSSATVVVQLGFFLERVPVWLTAVPQPGSAVFCYDLKVKFRLMICRMTSRLLKKQIPTSTVRLMKPTSPNTNVIHNGLPRW